LSKHLPFGLAASLVLAVALAAVAPPAFDSGRAYQHVRQIVSFGPRPSGSPALDATRRYFHQQLEAIGVSATDQTFVASTPIGQVKMANVVATIPGARPDRLVFGGHFDTKIFRDFPFVGANDGGSSAAFLLELARVLKARKNPLTMEIVFLDGEEATGEWRDTDHTYGSRYYVNTARNAGTLKQIRAFVLVDMIGGRDLVLDRDTNSTAWLLDTMWQTAKKLGLQDHFPDVPSPVEDDHLEFLQAGVQSVDLIDLNHYAQAGWWHTREDTLDKISARSLQIVGDVLMAALPSIEARLVKGTAPAGAKTAPKAAPKTKKKAGVY
jgi:Zn-dependent M28 family amino/carboxypeptidase